MNPLIGIPILFPSISVTSVTVPALSQTCDNASSVEDGDAAPVGVTNITSANPVAVL